MKVIGPKGSIALWTFALSGFVAGSNALGTEDVEALCEYRVLPSATTTRAVELGLRRRK